MDTNKLERYFYLLIPKFILRRILPNFSKFAYFKETCSTQTPITFDLWYNQKILGHCRNAYWPVHSTSYVYNPKNIYCGIETSPGYSQGNYIQAIGKIYVGDYTQIAANVGIISANHSLEDNRQHVIKDVKIGKYCWIGFGAVIMPGVHLGDYTVVGAGAIVTRSFNDGFCVIGGNPAKIIKHIDKSNCVFHKSEYEYNGYIKSSNFETYRKNYLNV